MVSFTTTTIAIVAAFGLVTPIAAGPIAAIASVASTAATVASAIHHRRGETSLWARDDNLKQEFSGCVGAIHSGPPPKTKMNADKSVDMTGVPKVCMDELAVYNTHPNIKEMEAAHGTAVATSANSIHISGLPSHFTDFIESMAKQQPGKQA